MIQLPLARPRRFPPRKAAHEQRLDRRILAVDDNEDAANATAMLIEEMGGDARVAYDGESALEMLQDTNPMILLDIGMRGPTDTRRVNGPVVCSATGPAGGVDRVRPGTGQGEGGAQDSTPTTKPADSDLAGSSNHAPLR